MRCIVLCVGATSIVDSFCFEFMWVVFNVLWGHIHSVLPVLGTCVLHFICWRYMLDSFHVIWPYVCYILHSTGKHTLKLVLLGPVFYLGCVMGTHVLQCMR